MPSTLQNLNLKEGDILKCVHHSGNFTGGKCYPVVSRGGELGVIHNYGDFIESSVATFRLVSPEETTMVELVTFKDLTPAQRSELLEAVLRKERIQYYNPKNSKWSEKPVSFNVFFNLGLAYRITPIPFEVPWSAIKEDYKWAAAYLGWANFCLQRKTEGGGS